MRLEALVELVLQTISPVNTSCDHKIAQWLLKVTKKSEQETALMSIRQLDRQLPVRTRVV